MTSLTPDKERLLTGIRLVAFDVDGTLTDGRVIYVGAEEQQSFCVHDGQGLAWLRKEGVVLAWITGRGCDATRRRAAELGVEELFLQAGPKERVLADIQERHGISPLETVAMGDDLPDLAMARRAAVFVAPANARPEVRAQADHVLASAGGHGAARELAELLLRAKDRWTSRVDDYVRDDA